MYANTSRAHELEDRSMKILATNAVLGTRMKRCRRTIQKK